MNRLVSWRPSILDQPHTVNVQGNWGLQGSAQDYRGRVYNLAAPIVQFDSYPWIPQFGYLYPFTVPQRIPNPSPGVRQLQQYNRPQRTVGPLVFNPANMASINLRSFNNAP
jgi:hypothetical protein